MHDDVLDMDQCSNVLSIINNNTNLWHFIECNFHNLDIGASRHLS